MTAINQKDVPTTLTVPYRNTVVRVAVSPVHQPEEDVPIQISVLMGILVPTRSVNAIAWRAHRTRATDVLRGRSVRLLEVLEESGYAMNSKSKEEVAIAAVVVMIAEIIEMAIVIVVEIVIVVATLGIIIVAVQAAVDQITILPFGWLVQLLE